jgi:RNA polymerase sigma-70 factor (ECF subfamily)
MIMNASKQPLTIDEETLVEQAKNGDLEAFNQLVLTYQDMAYHHALALLDDTALAEDATQESFIKAFQAINGFRGSSLRGWLLKIVTNSAYDIIRRLRRRPIQPLFPEDENGEEVESPVWLADPQTSVLGTVEQKELSKEIYKAIDSLPEVYRSVLTLIDVHELDYVEAAHALQVPLGTVKSRLARARLQMKAKLLGSRAGGEKVGMADLCMVL